MRSWLFILGMVAIAEATSAADPEPEAVDGMMNSLINSTDLGKNLKTLDDYYAQVNKQLNRRIKNRNRDPFEKLLQPKRVEEVSVSKPRFIPRDLGGKTEPTASKSIIPSFASDKEASGQLPMMQFRGFMQSGDDKAGLLEILGQGTFVVHEGDKVGLRQAEGDMVIRVVEINALNLIVEFGSLGEKVVVQ